MDHRPHPTHSQGINQTFSDHSDFLSGIEEYTFQPDHNGQYENLAWERPQYFETPENAPTIGHGQQQPLWHQSALNHSNFSPVLGQTQPSHAYQQSTFPPSYGQRPQSQTAFNPSPIPHQSSPSPAPYHGYPYQGNSPYPLAAYGQAPNQHTEYQMHQRPSSTTPHGESAAASTPAPAPTYSSPPLPDRYMQYEVRPQQNQQYSSIYPGAGHFGSFQVQQYRPVQATVDPNLLSTSGFPNPGPEQYQNQHRQTLEHSFSSSLSHGPQQAAFSLVPQQMHSEMQGPVPTSDGQPVGVELPLPKSSKKKDPAAPKKPRGRPRKDGQPSKVKTNGVSSASDSDSADELALEEPPPEEAPSLLSSGPPETPAERAVWDALNAVWSPRNRPASVEKIRNGIALYGELVKRLRDSWKADNETLKKAELENSSTDTLRKQVSRWRDIVQAVMETTLKDGHPSHINKLGESPWIVVALREFLVDRITASDWNGSLVLSIIKVMAEFAPLDQEMLEKTKMEKALARFVKKSGPEVKHVAQRVLNNASAASKRKAENASPEREDAPSTARATPGNPVVLIKNPPQAAGTKRPRDENMAQLPDKKPAPQPIRESSKPLALQQPVLKKTDVASKTSKTEPVANGKLPIDPKAKPAVPTPAAKTVPVPNVFSSLMSASKKPGTSNAARAAAAAKEKEAASAAPKNTSPPPTAPKPAPLAPPQPSFSFSQTLAGLHKPKEVEEKVEDDRPNETEEERTKRLRKESRRKLRVSWKPDEELTEVRIFSHHPDEEARPVDSMTRDMDDVGGEGRMLKMHQDLDEFDDDEEIKAVGEDLAPYSSPSEIAFEGIEERDRQVNFIGRGGLQSPDSLAKTAQDQLEQVSLMVVYALPSDIPTSPKEPPNVLAGEDYSQPPSFGEPSESFVRERERNYFAATRPVSGAKKEMDLSAILGTLGQKQIPQQAQPMSDLERTFSEYSHLQQPQHQPPQQPATATLGGIDLAKLLSVVQQAQQHPVVLQPMTATPDINALSASLPNAQQQPQQPSFSSLASRLAAPQTSNGWNASATFSGVHGSAQNRDYEPDPYSSSSSRKHGRDLDEYEYDPYEERKKKTLNMNTNSNTKGVADGEKVKMHPNFKTITCRFWKEGKCKKGDDCTYIHD